LKKIGIADGIVELNSGKEVANLFEMLDGPMEGHVGYFNADSVTETLSLTNGRAGRILRRLPFGSRLPHK